MTALTQEQFDALEVGTAVSVRGSGSRGRVWTRREDGWENAGVTVPAVHFAGEVAEGRVHTDVAKEPGQLWWSTNEFDYGHILLLRDENGTHWWCARVSFPNGGELENLSFDRVMRVNETQISDNIVTNTPAWYPQFVSVATRYAEREVGYARMRDVDYAGAIRDRDNYRIQVQSGATNEFREGLVNTLTPLMSEKAIDRPTLLRALRLHNINVVGPRADVEVTISVSGTSRVEQAADSITLPDGFQATNAVPVIAPWTTTVKVTKTVEEGECACAHTMRGDVRTALRNKGVEPSSFDVLSRSCPNDATPAASAPAF